MGAIGRVVTAVALALAAAAKLPAMEVGESVRVMTYNIRNGMCMDGTRDLSRMAAVISAQNPDFVSLQESSEVRSREIAATLGMTATCVDAEQIAVLSKSEPLSTEVITDLPHSYYKRACLICEFADVVIACTHLPRTSEYGLQCLPIIDEALSAYEGKGKPVLFMGDLNTRPGFYVYNALAPLMQCISPTAMADGEGTFCSEQNDNGEYTWNWILDFIYMDNAAAQSGEWRWTSSIVKERETSDHAPVVADVAYIGPYEYIRAGWPPSDPSHSSASAAAPLASGGRHSCATAEQSLEARWRTWCASVGAALKSDRFKGFFIIFR